MGPVGHRVCLRRGTEGTLPREMEGFVDGIVTRYKKF